MRKLLAFAAALGVMTVSGVAFSGSWVADVTLVDFQLETGLLTSWDSGVQTWYVYQHLPSTKHMPGVFTHAPVHPADPCDGLKHSYNEHVAAYNADGSQYVALLISIANLANARCPAQVEGDTTTNPPTALTFTPL